MRKFVLFAAVLTIASPSLAFAGEAKKAEAPAIKATQMTDAEMDKVTASGVPAAPRLGNLTAYEAGGTSDFPGQNNNRASPQGFTLYPGSGKSTVIH